MRSVHPFKIRKIHPDAVIPKYAHGPLQDAGMDLHSVEHVLLHKNVPTLVKTGLQIQLPSGMEGQVRPRSGLALKHGVTVWNAPGTIDPSYRGEVGVILLWNGFNSNYFSSGDENFDTGKFFEINPGDRIAQLVVAGYVMVDAWEETDELDGTVRGEGGFGSTGTGASNA